MVAEAALKTSTALQKKKEKEGIFKKRGPECKKGHTRSQTWSPFACDSDETVPVHLQDLVPWQQVPWLEETSLYQQH